MLSQDVTRHCDKSVGDGSCYFVIILQCNIIQIYRAGEPATLVTCPQNLDLHLIEFSATVFFTALSYLMAH